MYYCKNCWNESLTWKGQCWFCKEWNSLKEMKETKKSEKISGQEKKLQKISDNNTPEKRTTTKSPELNNVLGGGFIDGSVTLLSGEPGIGKSTLALQLSNLVESEIIYISWEETQYQIESRAKRLQISGEKLSILSENNLENILATLSPLIAKQNTSDTLIIIDSISVLSSNNISGVSGSISQIKYITEQFVELAKQNNISLVIIGHVTKDGNLAGPKTLEHMVDTVLFFEGEKYDNLRILRTLKNRFWATSEIGLFSMEENGLQDIKNPGMEFISNNAPSVGSSLSITLEGNRPLLIETESLTTYTKFWYPKRSARWINSSKLDLIIAVLGKYSNIQLDSSDVYSNIARGLRIEEPGIDLSIAASIISSKLNKIIPKNTIFLGEISLTGNIKNIFQLEKRLKEAEKLGIKKAFIPDVKMKKDFGEMEVVRVKSIGEIVTKF